MATPPSDADNDVTEFEPDFSLKNKIGKDVNIKEIFSPDAVKNSQNVINRSRKDFLQWVKTDLQNLENNYSALVQAESKGREFALEIQKAAFSIKGQSGTFGFDLGSAVAKSLYDFLESHYIENEKTHFIVIRKHLDTLNTIFLRGIDGDGGKTGGDVYTALGQLIRKFDIN